MNAKQSSKRLQLIVKPLIFLRHQCKGRRVNVKTSLRNRKSTVIFGPSQMLLEAWQRFRVNIC